MASPLIPAVRLARIAKVARRIGSKASGLTVLAVVLLLLAIDGLGELCGYAAGLGKAMRKLSGFGEFDRGQFLADCDQHLYAVPADTAPAGKAA